MSRWLKAILLTASVCPVAIATHLDVDVLQSRQEQSFEEVTIHFLGDVKDIAQTVHTHQDCSVLQAQYRYVRQVDWKKWHDREGGRRMNWTPQQYVSILPMGEEQNHRDGNFRRP